MALVTLAIILAVILVAAVALAIALSWIIGMITALIQHRRQPDFREHRRTGSGHSEPEPPAGIEPAPRPLQRGCSGRLSYGGIVSAAGFEPATSTSSRWRLCQIGLRGHGAAMRGGVAGHPGVEPGKLRVQSPAGLPIPPMAISRRGGPRTRNSRFLRPRALPVGRTRPYAGRDLNPRPAD